MKFSYNWLKEYVDIKKTPEKLAEVLTMHSFEAEGIERLDKGLENIFIGKILEVKKHPNADRLTVVTVNMGKEVLQIVCGAPNVAAGQKVAVAQAGAKLPNGMEIGEREVRGVKSRGMICAEDELGLGSSHKGIMVLLPEAETGSRLAGYLNLEDTVIDLNILPDRAHDALSYWGLAQEIAAVLGKTLKKKIYKDAEFEFKEDRKIRAKELVDADVQDKKLCRRYCARVVKNITVKHSPFWLQNKLKLSSIRPINSIVDIANLVMLETGQPLHIFDLDRIEPLEPKSRKKKIIVRAAKKNEKIAALDGKEYKLSETNLVIADAKKPLAIAGIMGGEFSSVSGKTKNIVIEAANFEPTNIRQSSKALGLASDSSYRFERDIDRNLAMGALNMAAELIEKISGGQIAFGAIDVYASKKRPVKIKLELNDVEKLLGIKIADKKIIEILGNLGFKVRKSKKNVLEVTIPTRRLDITSSVEIIREIARLYGYQNIAPVRPRVELNLPRINSAVSYKNKMKNILAANGFTEIYNYSFIGDKELANTGTGSEHYLELANPLNPEHKFLRLSIIPSILNNIADNSRIFSDENIKIFELGKVYYKKYMGNNTCMLDQKIAPSDSDIDEKFMLAGAIYDKNSKELFYQTKDTVDLLLNFLGIKNASYFSVSEQCPHMPVWHLGRTAFLSVGNSIIGIMGEIDPKIRENFKINGRVGIFNLDFKKIAAMADISRSSYKNISKFPAIRMDFAFLIPKAASWEEVRNIVFKEGEGLVKEVSLFDIYEGKNIPNDKRGFAFHAVYQSNEKTLTDEEVKKITDKIISELKDKLKANLRR